MKRAENLIAKTYGASCGPTLRALVEFACQNSGVDPRNYYDPQDLQAGRVATYRQCVKAYKQEVRSISADLQRFKTALSLAAAEGVTDGDIVEASKSAFAGRLTWEPYGKKGDPEQGNVWNYTTGQYFPTEYRKAAATVLERATQLARRNRPPTSRKVSTIAELKALNEQNGRSWFAKAEMRFFGTRIESGIIRGRYFISSEQPPYGARKYSVRTFDDQGGVETVGQFCAYSSKAQALAAIANDLEPVTQD